MKDEKLESSERVIEHFKDRAHQILDVLFVASEKQMSDSHEAIREELETAILIVWRHHGNREQILKELTDGFGCPDTPPDWL